MTPGTAALAGFADVFGIVVGVLLSLSGLGVFLMGVIALADRRGRTGWVGTLGGLCLLTLGLWLVGVIP